MRNDKKQENSQKEKENHSQDYKKVIKRKEDEEGKEGECHKI
jgi:hypothetical protein